VFSRRTGEEAGGAGKTVELVLLKQMEGQTMGVEDE